MNLKFSTIRGFFIGIIFASVCTVYAQDGLPTPIDTKDLNAHPELNLNEDKTLIFDGNESRSTTTVSSPASSSRESQNSTTRTTGSGNAPAKLKSNDLKATEKEQADPLSFNFLYYLIQKFKISDMVD